MHQGDCGTCKVGFQVNRTGPFEKGKVEFLFNYLDVELNLFAGVALRSCQGEFRGRSQTSPGSGGRCQTVILFVWSLEVGDEMASRQVDVGGAVSDDAGIPGALCQLTTEGRKDVRRIKTINS